MRRADLLALTGVTEQGFSALAHRNALPFSRKPGQSKTWTDYPASDLLRLDLAIACSQLGHTKVQAAGLVRGGFPDLAAAARRSRANDEIYFGIVGFGDRHREAGAESATATVSFVGSAGSIFRQIQAYTARTSDTLFSLVLINVSQRLRELKERAQQRPNGPALLLELEDAWLEEEQ